MLNNTTIFQNSTSGFGCVGGFFTFPKSPVVYGLSNNHVIANLNDCAVDDPVFDAQSTQIGKLKNWISLSADKTNFIDAALFEYTGDSPPGWRIPGNAVAKPVNFIEPRLNGHVFMVRDGKSIKEGIITNPRTNVVMNFELNNQHLSFSHLIEITPTDGNPFSFAGDSGSIILSSTNYIVGMLMGIQTGGTRSYAIPFVDGILKYLPLVI